MGLGVAWECAHVCPQVCHSCKWVKLLYLNCSHFREVWPRKEVRVIFATWRTEAILWGKEKERFRVFISMLALEVKIPLFMLFCDYITTIWGPVRRGTLPWSRGLGNCICFPTWYYKASLGLLDLQIKEWGGNKDNNIETIRKDRVFLQ